MKDTKMKKELINSKGKIFIEKDGIKRTIDVQGDKITLMFILQDLISTMIKENAIEYMDLLFILANVGDE